MDTDWLTTLQEVGGAIYDVFVLPGSFAWSLVGASGFVVNDDAVFLPFMFSLLIWFALAVVAGRIVRSVARVLDATIRTYCFRLSQALRGFKTRLVCWFRQWIPQRRSNGADALPEVVFDDLDLAVLQKVWARGPGSTMSAPELAGQFRLRPTQVQRSLDKLRTNRMLDHVIGSTDGFDNYRLTPSGAAFVEMWQRTAGRS